MITIEPVDVDAQMDSEIARLHLLSRPGLSELRPVVDAIRHGFAENFEREGSARGPWAPLARRTQIERRLLGYPPAHPILVRTGDYRNDFTNSNAPNAVTDWDGNTLFVGSRNFKTGWLNEGTSRMPARSVLDLDSSQEGRIGDALDAWTEITLNG